MVAQKLPKISIVTPAYNSAKYIEDCIRSVLIQKYPNFEHIIIDGCSTDGTVDILKKYNHIKWISEPDEGQSDALNKGFLLANGEIIGWCNSDDVYLPETFNKVVNVLECEKFDGVYSNLYFGDKNLKIYKKLKSHKPVKWLSLFHCFIPSATFFFKRKILDHDLRIDMNKHITMDKDFFARILFANFQLKYVNDYFAIFRWHNQNKSLDTKEIKTIRYREGLETFLMVTNLPFSVNKISAHLYALVVYFLLPYRKFLKLISR